MVKNWALRILGSFIGTGAIITIIIFSVNEIHAMNAGADLNQMVILPPELTPMYAQDCVDYWHQYAPLAGISAFATLNADAPNATNSAVWRPNLSTGGYYFVETYIPIPPGINSGSCFNIDGVTQNTSVAEYTIQHAGGISSVLIDQDIHAGSWVSLGAYSFDPGPGDSIILRDLTPETKFTRYVLFSQIRLTPAQPVYMPLVVNQAQPQNPQSIVVRRTRQAFDSCYRPTLSQMQTWWNASPYYIYNLYIGGVSNTSCHPETLTTSWIKLARDQGWEFIPTWVGPQAPCTSFKYRFSMEPLDAFGEGIYEAELAFARAVTLGLTGSVDPVSVLYYDMEAFYGGSAECRTAAQYFLSGWSQRLHELGARSGVYGSSCYYMPDWTTLSNPLDDAWLASWYTVDHDNDDNTPKIYFYDPNANVWNVACSSQLSTTWTDQQRIRQYSGGHNESWGGVAINLDGNIVDGRVVSPPGFTTSDAPVFEPEIRPSFLTDTEISPGIPQHQLVAPNQGWILQDDRLLWTQDGGESWIDRTPSNIFSRWLGIHFTDTQIGWALVVDSVNDGNRGWYILKTQDGGISWDAYGLQAAPGLPDLGEVAFFDFLNTEIGWLSVRLQSGGAFSLGVLFITQDGGITWEQKQIPIGDPVQVVDDLTGWTAGGASGEELYVTRDGGSTWVSAAFIEAGSGSIFYGLPQFRDIKQGNISVTITDSTQPRLETYRTLDGGLTWQLGGMIPLDPGNQPGMMAPAAMLGNQAVLTVDADADLLYMTDLTDSVFSQSRSLDLPAGVVDLDFVTEQAGWAKVVQSSCSGMKNQPDSQPISCQIQETLYQTEDGGSTWTKIR